MIVTKRWLVLIASVSIKLQMIFSVNNNLLKSFQIAVKNPGKIFLEKLIVINEEIKLSFFYEDL